MFNKPEFTLGPRKPAINLVTGMPIEGVEEMDFDCVVPYKRWRDAVELYGSEGKFGPERVDVAILGRSECIAEIVNNYVMDHVFADEGHQAAIIRTVTPSMFGTEHDAFAVSGKMYVPQG